MIRLAALMLMIITVMSPALASGKQAFSQNEKTTIIFFDTIRENPPMLRGFLAAMPKGADLHSHLSGAVYAEDYLQWAIEDNRCINTRTFEISAATEKTEKSGKVRTLCAEGSVPATNMAQDTGLYSDAINALSTRNVQYTSAMWGHDHFFDTFGKFGASQQGRQTDMLASVVRRAAAQNIMHLELMASIYPPDIKAIATSVGWNGDAAATFAALKQAGLFKTIPASVAARRQLLDDLKSRLNEKEAATGVDFIQQVIRTMPPEIVFAQIAYSFEMVRQDPDTVAFNLVAPEDNPVALRDYSLHMSMIDALYSLPEYRDTAITLHAGELTMGLVPPRELAFHIREAVEKGHARRIGHGVDIMYEKSPFELLRSLQSKPVAVEICLSSNDRILNVSGAEHPFPIYRQFGVPVVLNTDDEGVSRIDLTNEYVRAAKDYDLGYSEVKTLSRNSLEYSFLPGQSLWDDPSAFTMANACKDSLIGHETAPCTKLLNESEKARAQWNLEIAFSEFEREVSESMANR
ncbi:adenosine deaminase [Desulfovibrio mangrovi]|uniref:adenosine deaminase family protein n=1 Tax=Desulfovibrio mangrovi TaxID=2976983 RepID=UPI002245A8FA|nr:adenosine deaminase [Desulfovibrio mangrovi]UZP68694.1 adenosine deaminase [Desulfovibrio mangrovi]